MRSFVKLLGFFFVAVMGLSITACDSPTGGNNNQPESDPQGGLPPLTGTVSITGIAQVGEVLTANTASLGGNGDISYQWVRGGVSIGIYSTYMVQVADEGQTIGVTVRRDGYFGYRTASIAIRSREYFNISFADFVNLAPDIPITGPTISLVGNHPHPASANINVTNPTQYDAGSIRWLFHGTQITGNMVSGINGGALTLGPRIHGNALGEGIHFLTVEVSVNGVPYSRRIAFTVVR